MKSVDRIVGSLLVRIMSAATAVKDIRSYSIIIIRPGGIGDAILLIPAVNALRNIFPDIQITILAEKRNASAFKLCPYAGEVLCYDNPKELLKALRGNYDVAIDSEQWHRLSAVIARLTGAPVSIGYATNERKKLFTHPIPYSHDDYEADSFLNLLKPLSIAKPAEIRTPFLVIPESARTKAETLLGTLASTPFVSIFPRASVPERRWETDKYATVARKLSAKGIAIVVVGGKDGEADGDRIIDGRRSLNLAGKTSLIETAAIIEKSSVLISGDSGILHLGVGLGRPTVSLFGPGIANKWAPRGDMHIVINRTLPCSPCTRFGYTPKCPINTRCMSNISVAEVVAAVEKLLSGN